MIHGYDHIANILLQVASPKLVTRKDDLFELKLPLDTELLALSSTIRRELAPFKNAALFSASFDRTTDRTAEFWLDIPGDPQSVRIGEFKYTVEAP